MASGWNGSLGAESPRIEPKKTPASGKGLVVGGLVVLLVSAVAFFIFNKEPEPVPVTEEPSHRAVIAEVAPAVTSKVEKAEVKPEKRDPMEGLKPGEHRRVNWKRPANWDQLSPQEKTRIQPVGRVIKPIGWDNRKLFTERSDKKIERLLRLRPGQMFLGEGQYGEQFTKDFLESIKVPIIFEDEDTEEDRAMKQAVIDTRKELKEAYDRGEDIAKLMEDTERQLKKMSILKANLRQELQNIRRDAGTTEDDLKVSVEAANKILEENGVEPLTYSQFWFRKAQFNKTNE